MYACVSCVCVRMRARISVCARARCMFVACFREAEHMHGWECFSEGVVYMNERGRQQRECLLSHVGSIVNMHV